jgi:hypothetical protein
MDRVVKYVLEQKTIDDAITVSVMSKDKYGNKHSHQWRICNDVYEEFKFSLLNVKDRIEKAKNFDELVNIIDRHKPHGVGEVFCYDTTVRIGFWLNLLSEKVYIHAGTRIGLQNLFVKKISIKTICKDKLPEPFCSSDLSPGQLEDFFCIFKADFSGNNYNIRKTKKNWC